MNEELKIIISAVTDTAQKNIQKVRKELGGMKTEGSKSAGGLGVALKGIGVAAGVAVTAITAVTTALVTLGNKTKQYREEQARLNAAFLSAGSTSEQAAESYNNLYRFLGDSGKASEAAAHLAKLTTEEQELAEWTTALQGVYATFGESLPIEGLTEAANETARVGTVTGTLADALNWAGVNEDAFNASLAACNTTAEREALIRNTLNGLYSDAAAIYEKNNADIIAQNEAQARLDATTGKLGKTVTPLLTSLINLSNVLLTALGPAIAWVSKALTVMIDAISKAVSWVMSLIGVLGGSSKAADASSQIATGMGAVAGGVSNAASGAGELTGNLDSATKAAEKLKRTTAGFDELNVMSSNQSASSGAGGADAGLGSGGIGGGGGFTLDTGLSDSLNSTGADVEALGQKINDVFEKIKQKVTAWGQLFTPTFDAWKNAFAQVGEAFNASKEDFGNGFQSILDGFTTVGSYVLGTFIPNIVNSFSTNLAPLFGDVWSFQIQEAGKSFEWLGGLFNDVSENIIKPALESIALVTDGTFSAIGQAWETHGKGFLDKLSKFYENIRKTFNDLYSGIILPVWNKIKEVFDDVWTNSLQPLVEHFMDAALEIGSCLLDLYNEFIQPIVNWIANNIYPIIVKVVNNVVQRVGEAIKNIVNVVSGIITTIKGIVQFITGVFTGDWKKAWEGVKNIFKGIWDSLYNLIRTPVNAVIGGLNGLLRGFATAINTIVRAVNKLSFTVPDWVPGIGGKQFGFNLSEVSAPQIPKMATGGIVTAATHIIAGERGKEAILPLDTHTEWMDKLAEKIAEKNNNPTKVVLMLDDTELGWANIRSINGITKQTGKIQLAMA